MSGNNSMSLDGLMHELRRIASDNAPASFARGSEPLPSAGSRHEQEPPHAPVAAAGAGSLSIQDHGVEIVEGASSLASASSSSSSSLRLGIVAAIVVVGVVIAAVVLSRGRKAKAGRAAGAAPAKGDYEELDDDGEEADEPQAEEARRRHVRFAKRVRVREIPAVRRGDWEDADEDEDTEAELGPSYGGGQGEHTINISIGEGDILE